MTRQNPFRGEPLRAVLATVLGLVPLAGASGQATKGQDLPSEKQTVPDDPQMGVPMVPVDPPSMIAGGQEGQRLSGREVGALRSPSARVSNRIHNRVENRLRTRIDRRFDGLTDNLDQFRRAAGAAAEEVSEDNGGEPDGR